MLNINNIGWNIYLVDEFHPILQKENGSFALGVCDSDTFGIYINNKITNNYFKKVLCHEIVHAAIFSYGVYLTHEEEEMIADFISAHGEEIINITNSIFSKIKYK